MNQGKTLTQIVKEREGNEPRESALMDAMHGNKSSRSLVDIVKEKHAPQPKGALMDAMAENKPQENSLLHAVKARTEGKP